MVAARYYISDQLKERRHKMSKKHKANIIKVKKISVKDLNILIKAGIKVMLS